MDGREGKDSGRGSTGHQFLDLIEYCIAVYPRYSCKGLNHLFFWGIVRKYWVLIAVLGVCSIVILREGGVLNLDIFSRIADGDSSLNCYGGYKREQVDHLPYENVFYIEVHYGCVWSPKRRKVGFLVREYVGCETPWTSWIPLHKWGKIHVFSCFPVDQR